MIALESARLSYGFNTECKPTHRYTHTHTHITAAIREAIDAAVQAAPGATSKRKRVEVKID